MKSKNLQLFKKACFKNSQKLDSNPTWGCERSLNFAESSIITRNLYLNLVITAGFL